MSASYEERAVRFRKRLIAFRKASGLTQVDLAIKLGHPQSFISKVERGERRLDVLEFCDVLEALGKSPSRFLKSFLDDETAIRKRAKN